ncbi:Sld7p NDAI_0F00670 [Naumovozyma dairenensis CBS 421]|uniref:Mitochondrial morphogenesis protein SLD7 n=1 Tax=Naumovozyma dairenensis (strain ATCC 10597 / BCRC 20456 / CBS 421 / NBRC 0211 / NRRL Y-12639) TaxID=1071378 RepID=G0WC75_NAUDC|nr:hypothetical protein NDAI_0F00670 [Naumovozyma dairenensis CBS 421]CCD25386.1 hypothetical protein NDAI_0F00670 [Naumovozyma dairenensis CBS 421]
MDVISNWLTIQATCLMTTAISQINDCCIVYYLIEAGFIDYRKVYPSMLKKLKILKIGLGERHTELKLRDVQLWIEDNEFHDNRSALPQKNKVLELNGNFIQYVDLSKLPFWIRDDAQENVCFTRSATTLSYFSSKLKYKHRGIVIEIISDVPSQEFIVFYRNANTICWFSIDYTLKNKFDVQIKQDLSNNTDTCNRGGNSKNHSRILKSQENRNRLQRNTESIKRKVQFNEILTKLILSGLRLRGIPNTNSGFHRLYKMTFDAAEFAHRDQIRRNILNDISSDSPIKNNWSHSKNCKKL